MADNDRWGSGSSSWDRGYQTSAVNQGIDGGNLSSESDVDNRTRVMHDDDDDDRHWRDGHGSSD